MKVDFKNKQIIIEDGDGIKEIMDIAKNYNLDDFKLVVQPIVCYVLMPDNQIKPTPRMPEIFYYSGTAK